MPDGTLEEWHARMIERNSQQCSEGTKLNGPTHQCQDHWRNGTLHQLLSGSICQEQELYSARGGCGFMPNEIHVRSGMSYTDSLSHTHGWDHVEENHRQFGLAPTYKENFSQYTVCTASMTSWDQYGQMCEPQSIHADLPQPAPPPIPTAYIASERTNISILQPTPMPSMTSMGCSTSNHDRIALQQPLPAAMPTCYVASEHMLPQPPPPPLPIEDMSEQQQTMLPEPAPPAVKRFKMKNKALRQPASHATEPPSPKGPMKDVREPMDAVEQKVGHRGAATGYFRTDAEISATERSEAATERLLERWEDGSGRVVNETLEDLCSAESESHSHGCVWDQFAVNQKQFGVYSTYKADLSQYSTPLNMKLIPNEVKNWAKRVAQEIESEGRPRGGDQKWSGNDWNDVDADMLEEDDEEELWSSVPRTSAAAGASWSRPWTRTEMAPTPQKCSGRTGGPARKSWEKPWPQWRIKSSS